MVMLDVFQWAPTLGGECYAGISAHSKEVKRWFQWAPTLGGECYNIYEMFTAYSNANVSMGTHPWG